MLTRKRTIRFSDLSLDGHEVEAALDPSIILPDWSDKDRIELLQRPLFGECYGRDLVFPSMRPVAAWLAIKDDTVRDEMVRREPEALMDDGDPESFSTSARSRILAAYVERYGGDGWRGVRIPYPQVLRFASS